MHILNIMYNYNIEFQEKTMSYKREQLVKLTKQLVHLEATGIPCIIMDNLFFMIYYVKKYFNETNV